VILYRFVNVSQVFVVKVAVGLGFEGDQKLPRQARLPEAVGKQG
jgi:hypothetical protein